MDEALEDRIAELESFEPSDDSVENEEQLQIWVDRWEETPDKEQALAAMFGLLERYPEATSLGEPGPLVHAIEEIPGYEEALANSLQQAPTYYGVWMVNRILSGGLSPEDRQTYVKLLHSVAESEQAPQSVRATAQQFLEFQE